LIYVVSVFLIAGGYRTFRWPDPAFRAWCNSWLQEGPGSSGPQPGPWISAVYRVVGLLVMASGLLVLLGQGHLIGHLLPRPSA
jgi:hypothetical protein